MLGGYVGREPVVAEVLRLSLGRLAAVPMLGGLVGRVPPLPSLYRPPGLRAPRLCWAVIFVIAEALNLRHGEVGWPLPLCWESRLAERPALPRDYDQQSAQKLGGRFACVLKLQGARISRMMVGWHLVCAQRMAIVHRCREVVGPTLIISVDVWISIARGPSWPANAKSPERRSNFGTQVHQVLFSFKFRSSFC